jgi:hypothetical protein
MYLCVCAYGCTYACIYVALTFVCVGLMLSTMSSNKSSNVVNNSANLDQDCTNSYISVSIHIYPSIDSGCFCMYRIVFNFLFHCAAYGWCVFNWLYFSFFLMTSTFLLLK